MNPRGGRPPRGFINLRARTLWGRGAGSVAGKIRGLTVACAVRFFKKKRTRTLWVRERRPQRPDRREARRQFDYTYHPVPIRISQDQFCTANTLVYPFKLG